MLTFGQTWAARNRRSTWSDIFGLGLMGGSSPSYGAGWDQLFGNALLTIAGYGGNDAHGGGGGFGGGNGYNYANGFAYAGGHGAHGGGFPSYGGGFDQGHHGHHGHHDHVLGTHTIVTKKVGYPVPQPYPVPVERKIPYPVSLIIFFSFTN